MHQKVQLRVQPRAVQAGATKRAPGTTSRWVSANAKGLAKVQAKLQGYRKRKQWQNCHSRQPCAKHGARYYHMPKGGHVPHTSCSRGPSGGHRLQSNGRPHPGRSAKVRGPCIGYGALDRQVYASVKETQIHAPICKVHKHVEANRKRTGSLGYCIRKASVSGTFSLGSFNLSKGFKPRGWGNQCIKRRNEGTPDRQINRMVHVFGSVPSIFRKSNRYLLLIWQEGPDTEALCPNP